MEKWVIFRKDDEIMSLGVMCSYDCHQMTLGFVLEDSGYSENPVE